MDVDKLTKFNFLHYVMTNYKNPSCSTISEFKEDLHRIKYIKRLLKRYDMGGELKERLILNHLIVFQNVFGPVSTCRILFFKIDKNYHIYLKSFLEYLKYLPEFLPEVDIGKIPSDFKISRILQKLK